MVFKAERSRRNGDIIVGDGGVHRSAAFAAGVAALTRCAGSNGKVFHFPSRTAFGIRVVAESNANRFAEISGRDCNIFFGKSSPVGSFRVLVYKKRPALGRSCLIEGIRNEYLLVFVALVVTQDVFVRHMHGSLSGERDFGADKIVRACGGHLGSVVVARSLSRAVINRPSTFARGRVVLKAAERRAELFGIRQRLYSAFFARAAAVVACTLVACALVEYKVLNFPRGGLGLGNIAQRDGHVCRVAELGGNIQVARICPSVPIRNLHQIQGQDCPAGGSHAGIFRIVLADEHLIVGSQIRGVGIAQDIVERNVGSLNTRKVERRRNQPAGCRIVFLRAVAVGVDIRSDLRTTVLARPREIAHGILRCKVTEA